MEGRERTPGAFRMGPPTGRDLWTGLGVGVVMVGEKPRVTCKHRVKLCLAPLKTKQNKKQANKKILPQLHSCKNVRGKKEATGQLINR